MGVLYEIIGVIGVTIIILNFILESTNKLNRDHHLYIILFIAGSLLLFVYSIFINAKLFMVLNGFAILLGFYELYASFRKK